jgi:type I restriction enzyme M protein
MSNPETDATRKGVEDSALQARLTELFGPLADRVCGGGSRAAYADLVLSLIFLRNRARSLWGQVREDVRGTLEAQSEPHELLSRISRYADTALQEHRLSPGLLAANINELHGEAIDDLSHVVRLCEDLGPEAFSSVLDRFSTWLGKGDEAFFTPRGVTDLLVDLLVRDVNEPVHVYDPNVRGGELLARIHEVVEDAALSGASPSMKMLRLAGMNVSLSNGKGEFNERPASPWENTVPLKADFILTNPPFNSNRGSAGRVKERNWIFGPPPAHNDNYAWLQHAVISLNPSGRAAVLMPNQAAVSSDEKERFIRARMIEEGSVELIVALPRNLFTATAVPTMVWGLTAPSKNVKSILFIDARRAGSKSGKTVRLDTSDVDKLVSCIEAWRNGDDNFTEAMRGIGRAVAASIEEVREREYTLDPSDYVAEEILDTGKLYRISMPNPAITLHSKIQDAQVADDNVSGIAVALRPSDDNVLAGSWLQAHLHELCSIQSGPSYSLLQKAARTPDGVPLVIPGHLRARRIIASHPDRIAALAADSMKRFKLQKNDILIVRTGTVGTIALATASEEGWLPDTNLIRIRPNAGIDARYLLAFLSTRFAKQWITTRAQSATAIPTINSKTIGNLPVNLPPPDEQRRIGNLLSKIDAVVVAHRSIADSAEELGESLADALTSGTLLAVN